MFVVAYETMGRRKGWMEGEIEGRRARGRAGEERGGREGRGESLRGREGRGGREGRRSTYHMLLNSCREQSSMEEEEPWDSHFTDPSLSSIRSPPTKVHLHTPRVLLPLLGSTQPVADT